MATELTVVVPTSNESPNVAELIRQFADSTGDLECEIVFVDDSTDDTRSAPHRRRGIHHAEDIFANVAGPVLSRQAYSVLRLELAKG
ncbi:MAG: glycosyltransferase [Microbacterium sp.]|uniref:glycosyltransferase n=1 Tax=Microbacterium sp. TaxID=51671 RepID=UPI0039E37B6B